MYKLEFDKDFKKMLKPLPKVAQEKILQAVEDLKKDPRPMNYEKLKGKNCYRVRWGKYRIIYRVFDDKLIVLVLDIDHRKDIYR